MQQKQLWVAAENEVCFMMTELYSIPLVIVKQLGGHGYAFRLDLFECPTVSYLKATGVFMSASAEVQRQIPGHRIAVVTADLGCDVAVVVELERDSDADADNGPHVIEHQHRWIV